MDNEPVKTSRFHLSHCYASGVRCNLRDTLLLIRTIIGPLCISLLGILIFFRNETSLKQILTKGLSLNPEKGLINQAPFWLSFILPILYFFFFGWITWEGYHLEITIKGLSNFFEISTIPFAFLSLSIPLAILVSRLHSTEQTATQIQIANYKNNIDAFYGHRNQLFSYFKQIPETNYLGCFNAKFDIHPRVHKNFFIGTPPEGIPVINIEMFKEIENEFKSAQCELDTVIRNVNPEITYSMYIGSLCSTIYRLSMKLGLIEIYVELSDKSIHVPVNIKGTEVTEALTVGTSTDEVIAAYRYAKGHFQNLCDFAGYKTEVFENEEYKYINNGGNFRTINSFLVIEKLHETEIKQALMSKRA